jgi:general secretion pathway protein J
VRSSRTSGFTLIEVLVALVILAITMTLAYRATSALAESETRLASETARWRSIDAALTRLEADLRQAVPRAIRNGDRREPALVASSGADGNSQLAMSRAGPEFSLEPGIGGQRIGYRLASGRLEVLYWPELDILPDSAPQAYALVDDVAELHIDYLQTSGAWSSSWPSFGEPDVPRAVRVRLVLASGEPIERWWALR